MNVSPPFRCLFCLTTAGPFLRIEHPIPESLGNDDIQLAPGFVCDPCNEYFGAKVEQRVLNSPPFSIERMAVSVPTKKGLLPTFRRKDGFNLTATGWYKSIAGDFAPGTLHRHPSGGSILFVPSFKGDDIYMLRLLLKMGLELLLTGDRDVDPYSPAFNNARRIARHGTPGAKWTFAYGTYPREDDLVISEREDEFSPILKTQLYEFSLGILPGGEVGFSFIYRTHVFACMLDTPDVRPYSEPFNRLNEFHLHVHNVQF